MQNRAISVFFLYIQLYEKDFVIPNDVLCACECSTLL